MNESATGLPLNPSEMKELHGYLKKIDKHEKMRYVSRISLINFVWGCLMILGGILDLYVSTLINFGPSIVIWAATVIVAFTIQQKLATQPLLLGDDTNYSPFPQLENTMVSIVSTVIIFIVTFVFGLYRLEIYIIPFIAFSIGLIDYLEDKAREEKVLDRHSSSFLFASLVTLIVSVIDQLTPETAPDYYLFNGFLFGLIAGIQMLRFARKFSPDRGS